MARGGVHVEVKGFAELIRGSRELAGKIQKAATTEFGKVAEDVARQVDVPVRTGALAASVKGKAYARKASVSMGGARVPYARFVEYGGRGHPHNRSGNYLRPTAMNAQGELVDAGTRAANEEIGAMSWPSP
jgi:hypothetical protein